MANFTVFRNFKSLRKILLFFLIIPFLTFSQVEISKRKIELLPPVSSALKNAQISPNNPNYFSISKKTESKKMSSALKKNEIFLNPGDIYLKRLKKEKHNGWFVGYGSFEGKFQILVALNDRLEISALQFENFEVVITQDIIDSKFVTVVLVEEINKLPEIIILPYGLTGDLTVDAIRVKTVNPNLDALYFGLDNQDKIDFTED